RSEAGRTRTDAGGTSHHQLERPHPRKPAVVAGRMLRSWPVARPSATAPNRHHHGRRITLMKKSDYNPAQLGERAENLYRQARGEFGEFDRQARSMVNQRPLIAVLSALALGYFVARVSAHV